MKDNDKSDNNDTKQEAESKLNFDLLPSIYKRITECYSDESDKLLMLIGGMTITSGLLPNVYGMYGGHTLYPHLFLYVVGKASSGKGKLNKLKDLITPIQNHISGVDKLKETLEGSLKKLNIKLDECLGQKKQLLIPGNITNAGLLQLLNENDGEGIFFETEGDTIANAFGSEHGKFSDAWRKAFHHEPISSYRKGSEGKGDLIYISEPKLSILISSTPNQLIRVLPNTENGLFSRFMFLKTKANDEFINVFRSTGTHNINSVIKDSSEELLSLYIELAKMDGVEFKLTEEQQEDFVSYFNKVKSMFIHFVNEDLDASVNRMGCVFFRLATNLTIVRAYEEGKLSPVVFCTQQDYDFTKQVTEEMLSILVEVFKSLPKKGLAGLSSQKVSLYQSLNESFTTSKAIELGIELDMSERTIKRFLNSACFERVKQGEYKKKAA